MNRFTRNHRCCGCEIKPNFPNHPLTYSINDISIPELFKNWTYLGKMRTNTIENISGTNNRNERSFKNSLIVLLPNAKHVPIPAIKNNNGNLHPWVNKMNRLNHVPPSWLFPYPYTKNPISSNPIEMWNIISRPNTRTLSQSRSYLRTLFLVSAILDCIAMFWENDIETSLFL